jgi:hypothetical protein
MVGGMNMGLVITMGKAGVGSFKRDEILAFQEGMVWLITIPAWHNRREGEATLDLE